MVDIVSPNKLIPELISDSKEFSDNLGKRIKVNSIFAEFNETTNGSFKQLVSLSNTRYKNIRCGNRLGNILIQQKKKYNKLIDEINESDVFNNIMQIKEEKKKLTKVINHEKMKKINDLREQLLISTKDLTQAEILGRKRLEKKVLQRRAQSKLPQMNNNINFTEEPTLSENQSNIKLRLKQRGHSEEREEFISRLINEDQNYLNKNFAIYRKALEELKELNINIVNKKNSKSNWGNNFASINKVNLLSFNEEHQKEAPKKKSVDHSVNIEKLMRFTRQGKARLKRLHLYKEIEPPERILINDDKDIPFIDTVKVIQHEANSCLYIDEKFGQKMANFEKLFNRNYFPRINSHKSKMIIYY